MGKQDDELLTMARIKRLISDHPAGARYRIANWLVSAVCDMGDPVPVAPDPRQLPLPSTEKQAFPE